MPAHIHEIINQFRSRIAAQCDHEYLVDSEFHAISEEICVCGRPRHMHKKQNYVFCGTTNGMKLYQLKAYAEDEALRIGSSRWADATWWQGWGNWILGRRPWWKVRKKTIAQCKQELAEAIEKF